MDSTRKDAVPVSGSTWRKAIEAAYIYADELQYEIGPETPPKIAMYAEAILRELKKLKQVV